MRATVEKVLAVRGGTEILLTLVFSAAAPREHTYRVASALYLQAGSPVEGDALEGDALELLTAEEDARLAYTRAVKILAAGDNTRASLRRKLRERGFSSEAAEAAVDRLAREGYIREEELLSRQLEIYAKRRWGPKRILPTLIGKGFSRDDILAAIAHARDTGVYDPDAIKEALLAELPSTDAAARRAWLYKHGF